MVERENVCTNEDLLKSMVICRQVLHRIIVDKLLIDSIVCTLFKILNRLRFLLL